MRGLSPPDHTRLELLHRIRLELASSSKTVLTTHINADGDGAGSEAAMAHYLRRRGVSVKIVNPTPFPDVFRFMVGRTPVFTATEEAGRKAIEAADTVLVLDTAEPDRLGVIPRMLEDKNVLVIDHHPPGARFGNPSIRDTEACATGELVFDMIDADGGMTLEEAVGIYVAIVTDTGSFRYANTTERTHEIAARLLEIGVDPEEMYRLIFAQARPERLRLLQRALARLEIEDGMPVAWVALTQDDMKDCRATSEDIEGIVEFPRQIRGVEVAAFFRALSSNQTKVSLRSNGEFDVAEVAREHGGGGHVKAAGIFMKVPLQEAVELVLGSLKARF
jgi:phosphoesterase RecJ-like protein